MDPTEISVISAAALAALQPYWPIIAKKAAEELGKGVPAVIGKLWSAVRKVIFKALAKDPRERYENMGTFAEALESLKELKKADEVSTLTSPLAPLRGTERGQG